MDIKYFLKNPINILLKLDNMRIIRIPDKKYLEIVYKNKFHKKLNLDNPQTFNEKLQWLKLYDRNPEYTKMVDKYEAKKYVASLIGEEYIIPTIGVYDKFDDIDFNKLPNQFVIKCTHDSGGLVICKDKSKLDIKKVRKMINKSLKRKYFYLWREWPYKNVKPRIIIEKYMINEDKLELKDYKFFCFEGLPKFMYISNDLNDHLNQETYTDFFDMQFNKIKMKFKSPNSPDGINIEKPKNFDKMIEYSKLLAKGILHVRIDWYEINGRLYFGEITFYHNGGYFEVHPQELNKKIGDMINLPINIGER